MSTKANNLKIGLFTILAVLLLIAGLLAFGAKSYFTAKTHFETSVEDDVAGLSVGSRVELRGVPIGKVTRITFPWHAYPGSKSHGLIVEFEVDHDLMPWPETDITALVAQAVRDGMRAVVKGQGITGTSILSVEVVREPPTPPPLDYTPRFTYIPSAPGQFSRMLESIEQSLRNVQQMDFGAISQGVTNALGGVRQLSDKLDKLDLQAVTTNANLLVMQAKDTAKKLQEAIAQVQETLKGMKLESVSDNANGLVAELRQSNHRLQTVLSTVNTVPMRDAVVDLQQALQNLNEVLVDLKRYPSGFFLGEPPLPAKGVQPARASK
jgi:ABC-type transporter Mla subunit MlaD